MSNRINKTQKNAFNSAILKMITFMIQITLMLKRQKEINLFNGMEIFIKCSRICKSKWLNRILS